MRFESTYLPMEQKARWLRGNHHGHSTLSDGRESPEENIRAYEAQGYEYFAFSEHDVLLDVRQYQQRTHMCLLRAVEVTSKDRQTLMVLGGRSWPMPVEQLTPREIMLRAEAAGDLFIYDHPNWEFKPGRLHATEEELLSMPELNGMEIYTGVIHRYAGLAESTDRWDRMLSLGRRNLFGHATDDQHTVRDRFVAWNCVQSPEDQLLEADDIINALRTGRFYGSSGVNISRLGTNPAGDTIRIECDADEIHFICRSGVIVRRVFGGSGQLSVQDLADFEFGYPRDWSMESRFMYVRIECYGKGSAKAWSQPFWLNLKG